MPVQLAFTRFLNTHFGALTLNLLHALHVTPKFPRAPITNAFAMELLIFVFLLVYFVAIRASLSVEKPGALQHMAEMTHGFIGEQSESIIGHGFERFTSYLTVCAAVYPDREPDGIDPRV